MTKVRVYNNRKTTQDLINEEKARQNEDFNRLLKNAEDSMKAIYPEEYQKIRSRYFGNGNNLGLIGSQFNYIHNMITRNSDEQMKKYYNELNDYFIKQTGTEPGYMLPGVDVVDDAPDFNALRQKDIDRFYSPTENSDYLNSVEKQNARNAYLALQNRNADSTFDHDGYFDYDPNSGLLNTEANYARATGSYNYTPEEREAAATWERAENSPIVTAMEFSPLFPVVAGVKAVTAANAPQANGVDVGMNAAFAALPAVAKAKDAFNVGRKLLWNKMPQTTDIKSIEKKITDIYNKYEKDANSINKDELQKLFNEHRRLKAKEYGYNIAEKDNNIRYFGHSRPGEKNEDIIKVFNTDNDNMVFLNADYPSWGYGNDRYALNTVYKNPITIDAQNNEWYSIPVESIEKVLGKKLSSPEQYMRSGIKLPNGNIVGASKPNTISINHLGKIFPENDYIEIKNVIDKGVSPEMWNDYAKETGYVFDKNTDYQKIPYFNGTSANTQVMVRNPYQMKKISPITFDNNGKIIPISQRNDFSNLDINYSNGGVLDATYMEQINRIRQPRFAGWRFKDGGIYIKEENRGKFTEQAQRAGMTTKQFTSEVLENPNKYSPTTVKRARFSRNIGGN